MGEPLDANNVGHIVRGVATNLIHALAQCELDFLTANTGGKIQQSQLDHAVSERMREALRQLEALGLVGRPNEVPSRELWRIAGDRLRAGNLQWHARSKPSGYAGDFRMLEKIITHFQESTPFGWAFDRFFQYQDAPQAVRNRTGMMARQIVEQTRRLSRAARVVSVGSGPALDLFAAVEQLQFDNEPCPQLTLLDLDPYALENALHRLGSLIPTNQLQNKRVNLTKLVERTQDHKFLAHADLIICTGLFDYLDDSLAAQLLQLFWRQLAEGGRAFVFNFSPRNASRSYMEWIGNWYLVYRDVQEMWELVERAGIPPARCVVDAEPLGVNLFIELSK